MAWKRPLGCLPWDGPEKILSLGMTVIGIPNFEPRHLAALWEVLDASEADGIREVATDQLAASDMIVGAQINEAAFAALMKTGQVLFSESENTDRVTRDEFIKTYGKDPLEALAIKDMRKKLGA